MKYKYDVTEIKHMNLTHCAYTDHNSSLWRSSMPYRAVVCLLATLRVLWHGKWMAT